MFPGSIICGAHRPVFSVNSPLGAGLLLAAGLSALALFGALAWAVRGGQRRLRALRVLARPAAGRRYRIVETPGKLACCVGLLRPEVMLSRGLLETLDPRQLEAVLAHENAHVDRLDNLRRLLLHWSTLFWPAALRRRIRLDAAADGEQACDLEAARAVGDPALVASAIRALDGSPLWTPRGGSAAFGAGDTADRLAVLDACARQSGTADSGWRPALLLLCLDWCALGYALTVISHLTVEWLAAGGWPA